MKVLLEFVPRRVKNMARFSAWPTGFLVLFAFAFGVGVGVGLKGIVWAVALLSP